MKSTAVRLVAAAVLTALVYLGIQMVERSLAVPPIQPLAWKINDLPMHLDRWQGEKTELDPQIFANIGTNDVVNRIYRDDAEHAVKLHVAVFDDPDAGVYHAPDNCYLSAGWRPVEESREVLSIPDQPDITVLLMRWERRGEEIYVVYWFRLGDYVLYGRKDLGTARLTLMGRATWPPLIKVLLETPAVESTGGRPQILEFAKLVQSWLHDTESRTAADDVAP